MNPENEKIKICSKCKIEKSISEFHQDRKNKDGLSCECMQCKRNYRISPAYKEREKQLERTQGYKDRKKKYFHSDKGKFYKSKEKHLRRTRDLANPDKNNTLTYLEWQYILSKQGNRCAVCGIPFNSDIVAVRDCMIPLSKGGFLTLGNTQALCDQCNSSKGIRPYCGLGNKWRMEFIS